MPSADWRQAGEGLARKILVARIVDRLYKKGVGRTSDAKQRLLDSAASLMSGKGYGAVGVSEVCQRAGVNKGSFYHFFTSKQRLGIAVVDEHWEQAHVLWKDTLGDRSLSPVARLTAFFKQVHRYHSGAKKQTGCVSGCLLGNMTLELSTQDPVVQKRLHEIFTDQVKHFKAVIDDGIEAGELPDTLHPKRSARALYALLEGAVLVAKLENNPSVMSDLGEQALRLLGVKAG